jgi:GntR family transcriptional regulator
MVSDGEVGDAYLSKYLRIESDILSGIRSGQLRPGDKLPGQSEMRRKYGVSAITVRKAYADLINDGCLVGVRGSGTYVAKQPMMRGLTSISFSQELQEQGYSLGMIVDSISSIESAPIASRLGVDEGNALTRVGTNQTGKC